MWSNGDPRTEVGAQDWVAAARRHSTTLQEIRGTGPLVSGLMGMDMCVGCCRLDIGERLSAEQVANHPFIISCRKWSAEMDMISDLAPLLRHMSPGDVSGPGSHEWMMTSLPDTLQDDWALELIGSMIKYPFAVEIFVQLASRLTPTYTAKSLVDVLLETAVRAAHCFTCGSTIEATGSGASKIGQRCRAQMVALDAQGVCRFLGLPRILQKLGLMKKLTSKAAEALSHRFRGCVRLKKGQRQPHKHAGKKIDFGKSSYVLHYTLEPTTRLLQIVREHGPAPLQETSACVMHITKYQDMLRRLPRSWTLHPDSGRKVRATGSGAPKYVSTWVQRKHVYSQLPLRTAWPPGAEVDMQWLRSWCPDSKCRLGDYEDSMRPDVVEIRTGCP